ncbi:MAG TPA: hypothetical protein VIK91_10015 [Nannocystis sp.]
MRYAWPVPLLAVLASACPSPEHYDEGIICIDPDVPANFQEGDVVSFTVILDECMHCPKEFNAACSVTRDGDEITLDVGGYYKKRQGGCEACIILKTACEIGGLSPGTYTVRSGSHKLVVNLGSDDPVELDPACDGK